MHRHTLHPRTLADTFTVVLNVVMITLERVIAYGIDAGFINVSGG